METWREIVDKLRDEPCEDGWFQLLADRIEAACKTLEDVLIVEQDENSKLRRALEPVMKCDGCPMTQSEIGEVLYAVRKAQAIMRTEDEGQNTKEVV